MTADGGLPLPMRLPALSGLGTGVPLRFVGRARADPVTALASRMRAACAAAVDVDEIAALLEAGGINDRVAARDYGQSSVFTLAALVLARATAGGARSAVASPAPTGRSDAGRVVFDTLVRATLYLTPLAVGLGVASEVDTVPAIATTGTLVLGWGSGQALAYLGYRALDERGVVGAARLLALGFTGLAVVWSAVLAAVGLDGPRGFAVAGAQLAFFAVVATALVTGRERVVLAAATPCWIAAGAVSVGLGLPAVLTLLAGLVVVVAVAFRPAVPGVGVPGRSGAVGGRWRSWRRDLRYALLYGGVGTGQAVLLLSVGVTDVSAARVPPEAVPLLLGVPIIELTLVWHQRRVAAARAATDDRLVFDRRLRRLATATGAVLAVPIALGAGIAIASWLGLRPPGGESLAAAVLLVAVYALGLVLAAHRRAGTAIALVWWPSVLIAVAGTWAPSLVEVVPRFAETLAAATLLGACVPGLAVAALVLRDPESYR